MSKQGRIALGALAAVAASGLAACGDDDGGKETSKATSAPAKSPAEQVRITAPAAGASVGPVVVAKVDLEGFRLSPENVGKPARSGQGHLHFSMDGGKFDQPRYSGANGQLAVKLGVNGKYSPAVMPTITYRGLPKGRHTLKVQLANNDHSDTGRQASTSFTVR